MARGNIESQLPWWQHRMLPTGTYGANTCKTILIWPQFGIGFILNICTTVSGVGSAIPKQVPDWEALGIGCRVEQIDGRTTRAATQISQPYCMYNGKAGYKNRNIWYRCQTYNMAKVEEIVWIYS